MAKGGMAHDGANESGASNELFKMLVIKLELVIKIRDQGEYEDRSMCPGGRRVEDGKRAESCEQKWAERLKGKQSEMKTDRGRKIWNRVFFFFLLCLSLLSFPVKNLIKGKLDPRVVEIW